LKLECPPRERDCARAGRHGIRNCRDETEKDLKRSTKREDIAETVLILASPAASGVTGQVLAVTGWGL
jgi:enoyl-[acyl-carrier-protein] reductase (NADH)